MPKEGAKLFGVLTSNHFFCYHFSTRAGFRKLFVHTIFSFLPN
jgi:hypothetical protein